MAGQRIGGIAFFKINGAQYSIRGKFEVMPMTSKKTGVVGQDGPQGKTSMPVLPGFKGTLTDLGGVSVQALQDIDDAPMTLEQDNGKVWILRDGWLEGEVTVNTEEGSYEAEFRGMDMNEQTA